MRGKIAIVGAGILGRLCAWYLSKRQWRVSLFDAHDPSGAGSCSYAASGILAPYSGFGVTLPLVRDLGIESLRLWPHILQELGNTVFYQQTGLLMLLEGQDSQRRDLLAQKFAAPVFESQYRLLDSKATIAVEPQLQNYRDSAYFFPSEAQLDNREVLAALGDWTLKHLECHYSEEIIGLEPYHILRKKGGSAFDWVIDTRGVRAKPVWTGLRGVRGESIFVSHKKIQLRRPVVIQIEGQSVFVIPKRSPYFLIASTSIESESMEPISIDSTMKLLRGACAVHSGFKEAQIIDNRINLRPALEDGLPKITHEPGMIRINGLYRNGFLMAPRLVFAVSDFLDTGAEDLQYPSLFSA